MKRSDSISQLANALALAAAEFPPIERGCTANVTTKSGAKYSYSYADLNDILSAVRGPLAKNGLSISHDCIVVRDANENAIAVETTAELLHSSGEWKQSSPLFIELDGTMSPAQKIGSGCTYGKRYTSQDILGLSTEQDDDANTASGNDATVGKRERAVKPTCPKCGKPDNVIKGQEQYGGGWVCWKNAEKNKHGCGHKWQDADPAKDAVIAENYLKDLHAAKDLNDLAAHWDGSKEFRVRIGKENQDELLARLQNAKDARKALLTATAKDEPKTLTDAMDEQSEPEGTAEQKWYSWINRKPPLNEVNEYVKDIGELEEDQKARVWDRVNIYAASQSWSFNKATKRFMSKA